MGFAAGFAAGYEAVDKPRREEEARKIKIEEEARKLKQEEQKLLSEATQEIASHNKNVSDLTIKMGTAEDEQQYNAYASELKAANDNFTSLATSKVDSYKDTPVASKLSGLYSNARISNAETVEKTDIKDVNGNIVQAYLPSSMAQDKDNIAFMYNGNLGIA